MLYLRDDDGGQAAGADVLVIEDHADLGRMVALALGQDGQRVRCVGTAAEVVRAMAARPPRVVVLDLWLHGRPRPDLLAVARAVGPGLPVVVYTSDDDPGRRNAAMADGAAAYLVKGQTTLARLAATVRSLAGGRVGP